MEQKMVTLPTEMIVALRERAHGEAKSHSEVVRQALASYLGLDYAPSDRARMAPAGGTAVQAIEAYVREAIDRAPDPHVGVLLNDVMAALVALGYRTSTIRQTITGLCATGAYVALQARTGPTLGQTHLLATPREEVVQ